MKSLFLFLALLCTGFAVQANRFQQKDKGNRFGFYLTGHRTHTRIPFRFQSNLIIVPVCINNADTLQLIVDTGVSHTIITDPYAFRKHPLSLVRKVKLVGAGDGNMLTASVAIENTVSLGAVRSDHHNIVVLNEDVLKLSEYAGMPIHGIIGYELFANFVVTIDFQLREIILTQPQKYHYHKRAGDRYPIVIQDQKAYTDVLSIDNGTQLVPIRVVLDTGAGQALMLDRFHQAATLPLPDKVVRVQLGRGLNGLINGDLGRFAKVWFGRFELADMLVSFPDSTDFSLKLAGMPKRQGNVGCELLRRFRVTFNYPEHYIVLKPIKRLMRERFEHNMSGLELRARGEQYRHYYVDKIVDSSPAEQAGLQVGDELILVNNSLTSMLCMTDLYQVFQGGEGKRIRLLVRRNDQLVHIYFSLKRFI